MLNSRKVAPVHVSALSAPDEAAVDELVSRLGVLEEAAEPALASLVPQMRSLLESDRMLAYGVALELCGYALDFAYCDGFRLPRHEVKRHVAQGLGRSEGRPWALYDPRSPAVAQRNVPVNMPPPSAMAGHDGDALFRQLRVREHERPELVARMRALNDHVLRRIGMEDMAVCRVLVCDGPSLLAWVGAARAAPFSSRERAILDRLTPALSRRLRQERVLSFAHFHVAALPILLEAVAAEALVLNAAGVIEYANSAARALDREEITSLRRELGDRSRAEKLGEYEFTRISAVGLPPYVLAVRRRPRSDTTARLSGAAARWRLTRRQTQVLALLVHGEPTKNIATELQCVGRTVEVHVTTILANAGVESRAALIARFWTM